MVAPGKPGSAKHDPREMACHCPHAAQNYSVKPTRSSDPRGGAVWTPDVFLVGRVPGWDNQRRR